MPSGITLCELIELDKNEYIYIYIYIYMYIYIFRSKKGRKLLLEGEGYGIKIIGLVSEYECKKRK